MQHRIRKWLERQLFRLTLWVRPPVTVQDLDAVHAKLIEEIDRKNAKDYIANTAPVSLWVADANDEFKILAVSKTYEKNHLIPQGKKASDLIGKKPHAVFPKEVANDFIDKNRDAMEKGIIREIEEDWDFSPLYVIKSGHSFPGGDFLRGEAEYLDYVLDAMARKYPLSRSQELLQEAYGRVARN